MRATLIVADWAESINGKLYLQGAGWKRVHAPTGAISNIGVGVLILIDWDEANRQRKLAIRLLDDDGHSVEPIEGQPVQIVTEIEVGRPPGLKPGTELDANLAVNIAGLPSL